MNILQNLIYKKSWVEKIVHILNFYLKFASRGLDHWP